MPVPLHTLCNDTIMIKRSQNVWRTHSCDRGAEKINTQTIQLTSLHSAMKCNLCTVCLDCFPFLWHFNNHLSSALTNVPCLCRCCGIKWNYLTLMKIILENKRVDSGFELFMIYALAFGACGSNCQLNVWCIDSLTKVFNDWSAFSFWPLRSNRISLRSNNDGTHTFSNTLAPISLLFVCW